MSNAQLSAIAKPTPTPPIGLGRDARAPRNNQWTQGGGRKGERGGESVRRSLHNLLPLLTIPYANLKAPYQPPYSQVVANFTASDGFASDFRPSTEPKGRGSNLTGKLSLHGKELFLFTSIRMQETATA